MRKKLLLAAALIAGVASGAAAQEPIKFGVRAGLNVDNMSKDMELDSKIGFHLGAFADVPLQKLAPTAPEWLYGQVGLFLSTKGGKNEEKKGAKTYTYAVSMYYIEIPITASAKFTLTDDINLRLNFGPNLGFGVSGTYEHPDYSDPDKQAETKVFDKKGMDGSSFRFGLDFGGGIEYKQIYVGLNYDLGLTNIFDGKGDSKVSSFGISVGYKF
ncbi:MAG: PorT family protein [Prevotellaceae bacterium]|jgi:hypothetical protein|nr:PorT family protein [Prevotellaceae bacterium]